MKVTKYLSRPFKLSATNPSWPRERGSGGVKKLGGCVGGRVWRCRYQTRVCKSGEGGNKR